MTQDTQCANPAAPKIIVAIDGYSSSGKSTMARALARKIGYRYVDTGAMYRAVTLFALRHDMAANGKVNTEALIGQLPQIHISFAPTGADGVSHCLLNGEDVEKEIRQLPVSEHVSPGAAIPAVRHFLVKEQQAMGHDKGIVMDGRDIGTVVLPNATVKIFLTASPEARATRRWKEYQQKGIDTPYEDVLADVKQRDYQDTHRAAAPLKQADDAVLLDTSELNFEQSFEAMKKIITEKVR